MTFDELAIGDGFQVLNRENHESEHYFYIKTGKESAFNTCLLYSIDSFTLILEVVKMGRVAIWSNAVTRHF